MHVYSCQFMEYFCDKLCKCIILSCVVMNMHRQSSLWHPRNALAPPEHALNLYRELYIVIDVQMKDDYRIRVRCVENERAQIYFKDEFLKSVLGHK